MTRSRRQASTSGCPFTSHDTERPASRYRAAAATNKSRATAHSLAGPPAVSPNALHCLVRYFHPPGTLGDRSLARVVGGQSVFSSAIARPAARRTPLQRPGSQDREGSWPTWSRIVYQRARAQDALVPVLGAVSDGTATPHLRPLTTTTQQQSFPSIFDPPSSTVNLTDCTRQTPDSPNLLPNEPQHHNREHHDKQTALDIASG